MRLIHCLTYIFNTLQPGVLFLCLLLLPDTLLATQDTGLKTIIDNLSSFKDRTSGSEGNLQAADYIYRYLEERNLNPQTYHFQIPVRKAAKASITFDGKTAELLPLMNNAITPQAIDGVLDAPLYYVAKGLLNELDKKLIAGSVLLMDFNSGRNWLTAASLGARAVIFIDKKATTANSFFTEKNELSPIHFPCFWMEEKDASAIFGTFYKNQHGLVKDRVSIRSEISWHDTTDKNIYCLIEGSSPTLKNELLILEAFYDSTGYVFGKSPGADESVSIANLLKLADLFSQNPPDRSVMLVATSGHAQALHGMRDLIWSMQERTNVLRSYRRQLQKTIRVSNKTLKLISNMTFPLDLDEDRDQVLVQTVSNDLKLEVDEISRRLMNLRLEKADDKVQNKQLIDALASHRFALRKLSWRTTFHDLTEEEQHLLDKLLPATPHNPEKKDS